MDSLDTVFTLFMILFPALFTLFVRTAADSEKSLQGRKLARLLWLFTGIAVAVYLSVSRWQPQAAYFMWFSFFPLWFLLAMPLLRVRNPGWGPLERGARRSASLVRRDLLPAEFRVGWIAITALWGLLFCVSVAGLAVAVSKPAQWWLLVFNLAAGGELWLLHWAMRRSLIEPEPASPGDSEELRAERESFHRFKLHGWLGVAASTMLVFSLPSLLLIWYGEAALAWAIGIGAGGGTLIGIGGGVFGTLASIRRAKINRLYIESGARD
jgi:hypothetical protein